MNERLFMGGSPPGKQFTLFRNRSLCIPGTIKKQTKMTKFWNISTRLPDVRQTLTPNWLRTKKILLWIQLSFRTTFSLHHPAKNRPRTSIWNIRRRRKRICRFGVTTLAPSPLQTSATKWKAATLMRSLTPLVSRQESLTSSVPGRSGTTAGTCPSLTPKCHLKQAGWLATTTANRTLMSPLRLDPSNPVWFSGERSLCFCNPIAACRPNCPSLPWRPWDGVASSTLPIWRQRGRGGVRWDGERDWSVRSVDSSGACCGTRPFASRSLRRSTVAHTWHNFPELGFMRLRLCSVCDDGRAQRI